MGAGLVFGGRVAHWTPNGWALRELGEWMEPIVVGKMDSSETRHTTMLGVGAFTPDNLNTKEVVEGDRPYASILGLTTRRIVVKATPTSPGSFDKEVYRTALTTELTLGVLGLGLAKEVQTAIHRAMRNVNELTPYDPLGWHNQISDGGEPTVGFRLGVEHRVTDGLFDKPLGLGDERHFEGTVFSDATIGYYTNVSAGAAIRAGIFQSEFWNFTPGALGSVNQGIGPVSEREENRRFEFFIYGSIRGRAVAYNALLQGQWRDNPYELNGSDLNRWIGEYQFGPVLSIGRRLNISYIFAGRTSEIKGPFSRSHRWAGPQITLISRLDPRGY